MGCQSVVDYFFNCLDGGGGFVCLSSHPLGYLAGEMAGTINPDIEQTIMELA